MIKSLIDAVGNRNVIIISPIPRFMQSQNYGPVELSVASATESGLVTQCTPLLMPMTASPEPWSSSAGPPAQVLDTQSCSSSRGGGMGCVYAKAWPP